MKKIIFSLLLLCLLAVPGSAWVMTGWDHPDDTDMSEHLVIVDAGATVAIYEGHESYYFPTVPKTTLKKFAMDKPIDDYLGFTWQTTASTFVNNRDFYVTIAMYNDTGVKVLDTLGSGDFVTFQHPVSVPVRVEIEENGYGTGWDLYINGVLKDSDAYLVSEPGEIEKVEFGFYSQYSGGNMLIYDLSTTPGVVGCDDTIEYSDTEQKYTCGFPIITGSTWYAKCYNPDGEIIYNNSQDNFSQHSISKDLINESGTYTIRLFQKTALGNEFFYASRYFVYDVPSGNSITLDKSEYIPGNQMQIFSYIPSFTSGYKVSVSYRTSDGLTAYTYDVLSTDYTKFWTIPSNAQGGSYFAYLRDPSDNVVEYASFDILAPLGTTDLYLDKSTYENNDTVKITYKYLPDDCRIDVYLLSGSTKIYTTNWLDVSGSGVKTFNIGGRAADSLYVKVTRGDIFEGTILKDVSAKILSGEYFISGKIYDSSTNTPISGATIYIGGSETTSNALGYYEMTVLAGTQPVSIVCDGYNQYTGNVQVYSLSTSQNFYLVKTITTGSNTLYGTVTDYYTGAPLNSTYIQIKNGSTVYSMLTHSKTGNYLFDQEGLSGSWDVTVTKTGYDTHTRTVTIDGDTYQSIKLVPVGGSSSIPDDDSDSGSSGSSSSDRPSREAAKDSLTWLEETMPGLVKLAVLVFMLALVGWRF